MSLSVLVASESVVVVEEGSNEGDGTRGACEEHVSHARTRPASAGFLTNSSE